MTDSSGPGASAGRVGGGKRGALARRASIDPRALAAFRASLGLLLALDVVLRSRDLVAFYTDLGVLPRAVLRDSYPVFARFSLHALSGAVWVQAGLFALAAGFALALLVGYRTTLATGVSLVLLFSLHARNPFVLTGGDTLLLHLLFWGLFLPLGERWSLDARYRDPQPTRRRVTSVASAALLAQVVVVYVVNAVLKLRGDLWLGGEAVRYVFALDQFTVLFGDALANYPGLLELAAHVWLGMVVSSVLLIALTGRARAAFVALFVGAHLGMALTLRLGLFPLISIAGLLPFLPPVVWDVVESAAPDRVSLFSFPPRVPVPAAPETLSRWARRLRTPVVACLLVVMLVWNAAALGYVGSNEGTTPPDTPWNMFAPDPTRTVGWYVVPGELASSERVDAFHRRPVRWDRPPDVARAYPNDRWRKYLKHLRFTDSAAQRRAFADYLCDRWNRRHEDELVRVSVYFVAQEARLDGLGPTRRVELGSYSC